MRGCSGGGIRGCSGGVGGHVWLLRGGMHGCSGGHAWLLGGQRVWLLRGACVVAPGGACVVAPGGHAWLLGRGVREIRRDTEIRSMSGRYASYWNAFLFPHKFAPVFVVRQYLDCNPTFLAKSLR